MTGIEPYEVLQVLSAPRRLPVAAVSAEVGFIAIMGRPAAGRPLIVSTRKSGPFDQYILGARGMTPDELARLGEMGGDVMTGEVNEQQLTRAAEAFARGEVNYDETAPVELPPVPASEPMVMRGIRLPVGLDQRVRAAAERAGVPFSTLIREWIELGLTEMEDDRTVPLAALRRAIAHAAQSHRAA